MTRSVVIDANVVLAWLLNEEGAAAIRTLFDDSELFAPTLLRLEVANIVLIKERRKSIDSERAKHLLGLADKLPIQFMAEPNEWTTLRLADFARPHQLTAYDATYLEVAVRLGLPLFTRDNNLIAAARRMGIELVSAG